jgi:hypothetical protein
MNRYAEGTGHHNRKEHTMVITAKSEIIERSFANSYGERWLLRVEPASGDGNLLGDETDWVHGIKIRNDVVEPDYILTDEEARWLTTAWIELTGRELCLPEFNRQRQAALEVKALGSRR